MSESHNFYSDAVSRLMPSAAGVMAQHARDLREQGVDVVSLSIGQPDFDTPNHIKEAACEAINRGDTKYTPMAGTVALKDAIIAKFERDNGLQFQRSQITVSNGGKQALFNAMLATLQPGDEIILPSPYWMSYSDIAVFAGAHVVSPIADVTTGFKIDAQTLRKAITPRTKWLMINSPGNPSGACYTAEELRNLADVLVDHPNVWVMSDDMYEHLQHEGQFASMLNVAPELKDRFLIVNGVSKAYCMTGWRIGYSAGPQALITQMTKLQSQTTAGASSVSQAAAVQALLGDQSCIATNNKAYAQRLDFVMGYLDTIDGLYCPRPAGAFYVYPDCSGLIGKTTPDGKTLATDTDVALALLHEGKVAVVQGSAFGVSPCLRLSYATSMPELEKAFDRIALFCQNLSVHH